MRVCVCVLKRLGDIHVYTNIGWRDTRDGPAPGKQENPPFVDYNTPSIII